MFPILQRALQLAVPFPNPYHTKSDPSLFRHLCQPGTITPPVLSYPLLQTLSESNIVLARVVLADWAIKMQ